MNEIGEFHIVNNYIFRFLNVLLSFNLRLNATKCV